MYHGITEQPLPVYNWCHMPVSEFAEQMAFLAGAYRPLPLSEVIERMEAGRSLPERAACVTFDDGFRNNLTNAWPVLKKHSIPFTVFVSTSLPDTGRPPWPERVFSAIIQSNQSSFAFRGCSLQLSSAAERTSAYHAVMRILKQLPPNERDAAQTSLLRDLAGPDTNPEFATLTWPEIAGFARDPLVRFGSHTHTHEILTLCTPERQREELARSREILGERIGYCEVLAYPNGDHSQAIRRMCRESGYRAAVTVNQGLVSPADDLFALDRIGIGAGWSLAKFETGILG